MQNVGIDIGKGALDVCVSQPGRPARDWPVHHIEYIQPDWHLKLQSLIPPDAVVAFEPTGWHYAQPIVTALAGIPARLFQIPTNTTGSIRAVHVAGGKSDAMDARAIALAADWLSDGSHPVRGAYPYSPQIERSISNLRLLVNQHVSLTREQTRTLNKMDALGHSIWPALVIKKTTWLRAVSIGLVTPRQIHGAAADDVWLTRQPGYEHGNARHALRELAKLLPQDLDAPAPTLDAIAELSEHLTDIQAQLPMVKHHITVALAGPPFSFFADRWLTIPSSSEYIVAALLVACRGRPQTYTPDEFKAAVGVHPASSESGSRRKTGRGSKSGYRPAMAALHMQTQRLLRASERPNPVADYFDHRKAEGRKYCLPAARAKLARLYHGIAQSDYGYDPEYGR